MQGVDTSLVTLWRRMGMHVRLGLQPDDPRLLARYLVCGEALIEREGREPWPVHERMLALLVATARDALLPGSWRRACLEAARRPLAALGALAPDAPSALRLRALSRHLAQAAGLNG